MLRSGLLNSITVLYLVGKMERGKPDNEQVIVREEIKKIYVEQLNRTVNDLRFLLKEMDKDKREEYLNWFNIKYSRFLNSPIKENNHKNDFISDFKDLKNLNPKFFVTESFDTEFSKKVYSLYSYYSKFEHLGLFGVYQ